MSWFALSRAGRSRPSSSARPRLEELECRDLPSATAWSAEPQLTVAPLAAGAFAAPYAPEQIRQAYRFNMLPDYGLGQTIAVVVAYDDPNIYFDLAAFDQNFGYPTNTVARAGAQITKISQTGSTTNLPAPNVGWSLETSLDVEWAHAMAPSAHILLVEASSSGAGDMLTAVNYARYSPGVSVVSMSWGGPEFAGETSYDGYFTTPPGHVGVTFVAAAGDNGASGGPQWPSVSPNVLAVGGTSLGVDTSWNRTGETAWSGGGGGVSTQEPSPYYQWGTQYTGMRTTPDISFDANPATGLYVYDSYGQSAGLSGWHVVGGTSAATPIAAGLMAVVNQLRGDYGHTPIGDVHAAVYGLPQFYYWDITQGSNGYAAGPGYDLVTGRGTPLADFLIYGLFWVPVNPGIGAAAGAPSGSVTATVLDGSLFSGNDLAALMRSSALTEPIMPFLSDATPPATVPVTPAPPAVPEVLATDPARRQVFLSGGGDRGEALDGDSWDRIPILSEPARTGSESYPTE
jgi:subtilase family serine protease